MKPLYTVALSLLVACGKPAFVMPAAPAVGKLPAVPTVPRPEAVEGALSSPVTVDDVRVETTARPDPMRLAILPVTINAASEEGLGSATAWLIEDRLPRILLEQGLSHFIGPDVLMQVPAEKQANRDGTVRWSAPLGTLMQVEPVTAADLVLGLEVRRAQAVDHEVPVTYRLDAKEAESYAAAFARWRPAAEAELAQLKQQRAAYADAYAEAARRYEDKRGKYGGDEDDPTSGDLARSEYGAVLERMDAHIRRAEQTLAETPTPADLAAAVAGRKETRSVRAFELALRARLVDAHNLQVQWIADLSTRDADQDAAAQRVLETVVAGVR